MNELITKEQQNEICAYLPEHKEMLSIIESNMPEITRATSLFHKSQSQFMDNMMIVNSPLSGPTPIRNLRQILAEINKSRLALQESFFNIKKKNIEIKMLKRDFEIEKDELKKEMIDTEISEKQTNIINIQDNMSGAIRKITNYTIQYNSILETMGKKDFNEIDFEEEEERYHIMKAFDQALTAARAHGGNIDEGNHIYLNSIGINGSVAQVQIIKYLIEEKKQLDNEVEPRHDSIINFLNKMANKFLGCATRQYINKGMTGKTTEAALIKIGKVVKKS